MKTCTVSHNSWPVTEASALEAPHGQQDFRIGVDRLVLDPSCMAPTKPASPGTTAKGELEIQGEHKERKTLRTREETLGGESGRWMRREARDVARERTRVPTGLE